MLRPHNVKKHDLFKIGACPKCKGTQQFCEDQAGPYLNCMNCGQMLDCLPEHLPENRGDPRPKGAKNKRRARAA